MAHATKEKADAYAAAYREKNRERLKAYRKSWYRRNLDRERGRGRESATASRERHPEKQAAANKKFYAENRDAQIERAKKWARANPAKVKAKKRRGAWRAYLTQIRQRHGLTEAAYCAMMGEQNGLCKICRSMNDGAALHVDHEHVGGYETMPPLLRATFVRGLLCFRCNSGIGQFRDDPQLLRAAIAYLGGTP